jgi:alpha-glucosidase (family GH31 glycosyl hydrolase)
MPTMDPVGSDNEERAMLRIDPLGPRAVRITRPTASHAGASPGRAWVDEVLPGIAAAVGVEGELSARATGQGCRIYRAAGEPLVTIRELGETARGRTRLVFGLEPGERFYGWGERFDRFARMHGVLRLRARESPAFTQQRQSYSAIPFVVSSRGYALLLLNSHASTWRLRPPRARVEVLADGPGADCIVIAGQNFKEILSTYTSLTGRAPLPPRWALGLWVTEFPQEGERAVLDHVEAHRAHRIPLDAVILDYHWEELFHNFRWRATLFSNPVRMIERLRAAGVRLGLIFTPFLNTRHGRLKRRISNTYIHSVPRERMMDDERDLEGWEQARRLGLLAHEHTAWWFGAGGMVDFTNPAAGAWWNARLRSLYEQGVAFFKNDDGEYLPREARSHLGLSGTELHNLYGFFYGRAIYEGMRALDDRRPMIYARSVWAGSQRYPGLFLGDQTPTFEHMRATLRAGLNMSFSGFTWWGADIFGLSGRTTAETHMRYAQWAMLNPLARYFWRPAALDNTRLPWSHGVQAEDNFRRMADLRYCLLPYLYALAWEAYLTGVPMVRPMTLEFPSDAALREVDDQYMLGGSLLAAPVLEAGVRSRRVRLPQGEWHDFWTDASHTGPGDIATPAPLDRLPLFVRGGAIVPLGPRMDCIPDGHVFDDVRLHIWPPLGGEALVYDDDGRTRGYSRGERTRTRIECTTSETNLRLKVHAAEGTFAGQPDHIRLEVVLHRAREPRSVRVDGADADNVAYEAPTAEMHVRCTIHPRRGCDILIEL